MTSRKVVKNKIGENKRKKVSKYLGTFFSFFLPIKIGKVKNSKSYKKYNYVFSVFISFFSKIRIKHY